MRQRSYVFEKTPHLLHPLSLISSAWSAPPRPLLTGCTANLDVTHATTGMRRNTTRATIIRTSRVYCQSLIETVCCGQGREPLLAVVCGGPHETPSPLPLFTCCWDNLGFPPDGQGPALRATGRSSPARHRSGQAERRSRRAGRTGTSKKDIQDRRRTPEGCFHAVGRWR